MAAQLTPSKRGELELSDLNQLYLSQGKLRVQALEDSVSWMDVGSADAVLDAANMIRDLERRTGCLVGSVEMASLRRGFITRDNVHELGRRLAGTSYGDYLLKL